jgi:hypothetical protein
MAYRLELPANCQVHPVFHIFQLKSFTTYYSPAFQTLPTIPQPDLKDMEHESVLHHRLFKKGNSVVTQIMVKWTSLLAEMVTWEDYEVLKANFPSSACRLSASSAGGNVIPMVG